MRSEEIRHYVHRLRPYLATAMILFAAGFLIGVVGFKRFPAWSAAFEQSLGGFVKLFHGLPKLQLALAIFVNNALKTLAVILLGAIFGVLPAVFLLVNGAALGLVMSISARGRGIAPTLLSILPHGILELPAVILGCAMGLMIGASAARNLLRRSEVKLKLELALAWSFFRGVILPVLLAAAVVEAYLTSALVGR